MRSFLIIFILAPLFTKGQFYPLGRDTHQVLQHLVNPVDSLFRQGTGSIEIRDYNGLQKYLKPMSRYLNVRFDFSKQYIGISRVCIQCLAVCHHYGELPHRACHRNSCRYTRYWTVKDRQGTHTIDYTKVEIKGFSPHLQENKRKDTLIIYEKNLAVPLAENGPEYIYLHSILGGDCHARFSHEIFQDEEKKTITWIIHNYYGGCRAGYMEEVYFRIKNPGAGYTFIFNEVLED